MMGRKLLAIASAVGLTLALAHGSAFATHTKDEAGCVNAMNKDLGKMMKSKGKDFTKCVKDASKSKVPDAQVCFDSDPKGKIAKQILKTIADEGKKCGSGGGPSGYTSGANVNSTGESSIEDLVSDVFGGSMSGLIATTKVEGGCQAAVTKRTQKIVDTKMKVFGKCKKDLLKAGGDTIGDCVTGGSGIAGDPKGKIAKAQVKLGDDIVKKCPGGVATSLFPGQCNGLDGNALRDCLDELAECRVCLAINAADGTSVDCDLFDDGLANSSCPPTPELGVHKCTLDAGSMLTLHAGLPLAPVAADGAIDIDCGSVDGGTGKAPCECTVQAPGFDPLLIAGVFWACVKPAATACPLGEIDCDGGNALGVDMEGNSKLAACTSNADCLATCAAHCAPDAAFTAQCEGFCTAGTEMACTTDAQCGGAGEGSCNGPDGAGFGNVCDCTCLNDAAHGPSSPGDLACQLAFNLTVEPNPGNGVACDGADVSINVGDTCAPLSTQMVTAVINNGNNGGGQFPPGGFSTAGSPLDCGLFASSDTSSAVIGGAAIFYASTVGDINTQIDAFCQ